MTEAKKTAKSSKPKAESKKAVVRKRKEVEKIVDPGAPSSNEALEVKQTPDKVTDAVTEAVIVTNDDGLATEEQKSPVAKAGKRSAKAEKEQDEKTAKEDRKVSKTSATEAPKPIQKATRTKSERAGKKYREVVKLIDTDNTYTLADALELAIKTTTTKFDSSVELHIRLGVDPKQADQNIRGNVVLPAGSGKTVKIAVLCEPGDEKSATAAGADIVGAEKSICLAGQRKL